MKRLSGVVAVGVVGALFGGCASAAPAAPLRPSAASASPSGTVVTPSAVKKKGTVRVLRTITTGLEVPWGMAVLPGGKTLLVTQRNSGKVTRVSIATGHKANVGQLPSVNTMSQGGEAGALGLAISPHFSTDRRVYFDYSTSTDNRIAWAVYGTNHKIGRLHVILKGIPHGTIHNGGRIAFGPDGHLYVGTGETGNKALAQDKKSLGGKVLRLTPAGKAAAGNPFGNRVWTYGHRNVEGLAFDPAGHLWASEFGENELDELNHIVKGHDYGWPDTQGKTTNPKYTSPVAQWGTSDDSPSGIAWADGAVWMAALKGARLWRIPINGTKLAAQPQAFLANRFGRLRSVVALNSHTLIVATSNRDGRGSPTSADDRLILLRVS